MVRERKRSIRNTPYIIFELKDNALNNFKAATKHKELHLFERTLLMMKVAEDAARQQARSEYQLSGVL